MANENDKLNKELRLYIQAEVPRLRRVATNHKRAGLLLDAENARGRAVGMKNILKWLDKNGYY